MDTYETYKKLKQLQADLRVWSREFSEFRTEVGELHSKTMNALKRRK